MTEKFPISKSILTTTALEQSLTTSHGLTNVTCRLIQASMRDVYEVFSKQGRYILHVYLHNQRPASQLQAEWDFIEFLNNQDVPVAPAIPTTDGNLLLTFSAPEGNRHGVLSSFVEGRDLRKEERVEPVRECGRIVARIHSVSDISTKIFDRPDNDVKRLIKQATSAFEAAAKDRPKDVAFVRKAGELLIESLSNLHKEKTSYGMIHGDVIRANALVSSKGKVTLIDFDLCGPGWRTYDVASFLSVIKGFPNQDRWSNAFLSGYQEIRPLTDLERGSIPPFEAVRALFEIGVPAQYINLWGKAYFYSHLDSMLKKLRQSIEHIR